MYESVSIIFSRSNPRPPLCRGTSRSSTSTSSAFSRQDNPPSILQRLRGGPCNSPWRLRRRLTGERRRKPGRRHSDPESARVARRLKCFILPCERNPHSHAAWIYGAAHRKYLASSGQRVPRDSVFQPRAPLRHRVNFEQVGVSFFLHLTREFLSATSSHAWLPWRICSGSTKLTST